MYWGFTATLGLLNGAMAAGEATSEAGTADPADGDALTAGDATAEALAGEALTGGASVGLDGAVGPGVGAAG